MKKIAVVMCGTLLMSQAGCSFFAGSTVPLSVMCNDTEADLYVDGNPVGKGSATVMVARDLAHTIMAQRGDRARSVVVGTRISTAGALDIVGGFLFIIPFIGLVAPGARSLDVNHVTVVLPNVTVIGGASK